MGSGPSSDFPVISPRAGNLKPVCGWTKLILAFAPLMLGSAPLSASSLQLVTGSEEITTVDGTLHSSILQVTEPANISDGETFSISSGGNTVLFEFDSSGDGVSAGNIAVDTLGAVSAQDIRNSILSSFSSVSGLLDASASQSGSNSLQITTENVSGLSVNSFVSNSMFSFSPVVSTDITSTSIIPAAAGISQITVPAPASVYSGAPFTASIVATAPSDLADGDVFSISKGNESLILEIEKSGDGVSSGNQAVDISSAVTDLDVRDAIASAIAGSSALTGVTVSVHGNDTVALDTVTVPLELSENIGNAAFQVVSSPFGFTPISLSFDYLFETLTGDLAITLGGDLLGILSAPGNLETSPDNFTTLVSDTNLLNQAGLSGVELELELSGVEGSSILIDNIMFAGLLNGNFNEQNLESWNVSIGGSSQANAVASELSPVPIPGALLLATTGFAFLFGFASRAGR